MSTASFSRALTLRLFALAVVLLVAPAFLLSAYALGEFQREMLPEMDKKAAAVGRSLAVQFNRALSLGIPLPRILGVKAVLDPVLRNNPEIAYVGITDAQGRLVISAGRGADPERLRTAVYSRTIDQARLEADPITIHAGPYSNSSIAVGANDRVLGYLHVGVDEGIVRKRIQDIMYDVATVLVVSALVAFELLLFLVARGVAGPLARMEHLVNRVRKGDLAHSLAVTGWDEVGRLQRAVNRILTRLNAQHGCLTRYVQDIRQFHFDPHLAAGAQDTLGRLSSGLKFRAAPPEGRGLRSAMDVRAPLFIFVFAEELLRAFLPLHARGLQPDLTGLALGLAESLPIAVAMAVMAVAFPAAAPLVARFGSRPVFLGGVLTSLAGFLLSGLASGPVELVLWRAVTGLGTALAAMACYCYARSAGHRDGQGMGVCTGAVLAAAVGGAAIGGVLADRLGPGAVFAMAGILAATSGWLAWHVLEDDRGAMTPGHGLTLERLRRAVAERDVAVPLWLGVVPARLALAGFLFYLVPLSLGGDGASAATIGRVVMASAVAALVAGPLVAWAARRLRCRREVLAAGHLLAGLGLMAVMVWPGTMAIVVAACLLGAASSPLFGAVPDLCTREDEPILRLLEGVGAALGPVLAALMVPAFGYSGAAAGLGVLLLASGGVFLPLIPALRGKEAK